MRTKGVLYRNIGLGILILTIGIVLGCTVKDWPLLTLKTDVDVIGALSSLIIIGATLFIAYYVANSIEKQKENNRVEKDLVIKRIDDVYNLIEDFSLKLDSPNLMVATVNSYLKRINVNSLRIISAVGKTSITIEDSHRQSITSTLATLRTLLTLTPTNGSSAPGGILPISVTGGITHFSENRRLEIDNELDTVKGLIFDLELAINKG